jgi:mRNA (guanine-N7-)-methyltransferase
MDWLIDALRCFHSIAEDYNLELEYKKLFHDVWKEEKDDPELKVLSERMGVRNRDGSFALGEDEWEACGFYLAFAFRKA